MRVRLALVRRQERARMKIRDALMLVIVALGVGFAIGRYSAPNPYQQAMQAAYDNARSVLQNR